MIDGGRGDTVTKVGASGAQKWGDNRERGRDDNWTMDGREVDTEEDDVEGRGREGDTEPGGRQSREGRKLDGGTWENEGRREEMERGETPQRTPVGTAEPARGGVGGGRRRWRGGEILQRNEDRHMGWSLETCGRGNPAEKQ